MKMKNQSKKTAKALAVSMFAVGFVTPLMFSNIVEAENFGAGGTGALCSDAQLNTFSAKNSNTTYGSGGTWNTNISNANCVMINGYRFKVVKTEAGTGTYAGKQILTLWSYNSSLTGATKSFATNVRYDADGDWSDDAGTSVSAAEAYNHSTLKTAMDGLLTTDVSGNPNGGELYDSKLTYVKYTSTTDSNVTDAYVWAPSKTEVESTAWGDGTNALTDDQRAIGSDSWLRSPDPDDDDYAYGVYSSGSIDDYNVVSGYLLRPALQILNQTSWVFTTNVTIPENGVFIADGSDTATSYCLNSSTAKPTLTPTSGVILNGTKIGITTTDSTTADYVTTGLLTTNAGTTWDAINTGDNANIAYMAQVKDGELDLKNVDAGTDYNLKIFGLKTADTAVTQLADNAVQGLSKGSDGKIHMQVSGSVNAGVPVTVSDGAAVDLAGDANNPVTVIETGTAQKGKLNIGNNTYSGEVTNKSGELAVTADANGGTMTGPVSGNGKLIVESGKLIYTGSSIENDVEIKAGATLDPDAGVFANGTTITNYGTLEITGGTLNATIDGKGGDNLVMKGQMEIGADGKVKQVAGSNITVAASMIEADTNDATKAMFTGVTATGQLNVSAGNLTLTGTVYENMYYVLVSGGAVGGAVTASDLWKVDNVQFPGVLLAEYDTNIAGGSIALKMTKVATFEEGNTSGLAAVQQGNMSVAKEHTDEVANRLSLMSRPSLLQKVQAKVRNVAGTADDKYNIEIVEQGKAEEIMPVQVVEKDKYDKEVWASYIRTKETTEGMKLGAGLKGDNTAQYNGYVVGVDFYSSKKAIAGMALSYTTGDIDSYSGTTSTRNKSKYYGVSFYDRVTNGNTALIYDVGYIRGDNDISQFYTGKETTSDVKTNTYTAGARWEAEIETGRSKIVPFAAFRYMRVNNGDYTNSHGTKFETKNQNLYIPKVGIAWTGDFIMPKSVWTWRPSVEAGYVWNLGDRTADSNVLMGARPAAIEYDTVDKSSYYAKLGMEFMCKNFTAGLFYRYLKGDKVRNNKWNVNVSWAF